VISTATCSPARSSSTRSASVTDALPATFRANISRERRLVSGATTDVNFRPRTSPTSRSAAGLIQRMTPVVSRT
jgi:hypothetical protein